ncbi:MAG TPA: hypothetical protein PK350_05185, partial [Deltaproteobacteria bacterium]|nr:hypothetical protein [Deltaproteobacteria bacterium]
PGDKRLTSRRARRYRPPGGVTIFVLGLDLKLQKTLVKHNSRCVLFNLRDPVEILILAGVG